MGKHVAVDFRGVLRVQDREKFKRTFAAGIGSAKGFGFGLLMLEPVE
jgi:CRISPR system Cascade subunit CasE